MHFPGHERSVTPDIEAAAIGGGETSMQTMQALALEVRTQGKEEQKGQNGAHEAEEGRDMEEGTTKHW